MSTKLEAAARQALEALEYVLKPTADFDEAVCQKLHDTAIAALREALAEQQGLDDDLTTAFMSGLHRGRDLALAEQAAHQEPVSLESFNSQLKAVLAQQGVTQAQVDHIELLNQVGSKITITNGTFKAKQAAEPVSVPALVGVLATLPAHIKEAVEAYGAACARVALLATHSAPVQQAAEPVGTVESAAPGTGGFHVRLADGAAMPTVGATLYTQAPTQQPLTDAAIDSLYQHMAADERTKPFTAQNWFQAGVASAEAAHGITGSKA